MLLRSLSGARAILVLLAMSVFLLNSVQAATARSLDKKVITQLIVKYTPPATAAQVSPAARQRTIVGLVKNRTQLATRYVRALAGGEMVLALPYPMSRQAARDYAAMIAESDQVQYAEPDKRYWPTRTPDDSQFSGDQWHLQTPEINAGAANLPAAWALTTGNSAVVVSVIDSGVLNHDDLKNRLIGGSAATSGYDFISDENTSNDGNGRDTDPTDPGDWTTDPECDGPTDSSWHGTHVAGTIGAESNNALGVTGVDWQAKLLTARALGACGGSQSDINDAISWSVGLPVGDVRNATPAKVINMSLGGEGECGDSEQAVINTAVARGTVVVVAAGNENADAATSAPGNCNNVITVAALDKDGSRAEFSNFGRLVDIAAPGVDIMSTVDAGTQSAVNDHGYQSEEGTSMAAPHVTGVIALMLGSNSHLTDGSVTNIPALIKAKVQASARPFPSGTIRDCTTSTCGAGMLDAHRAIIAVNTPPTIKASDDQASAENDVVIMTAMATDDEFSSILRYQWRQTAGSTVTLAGATTTSARFTAPDISGELVFMVTVTDDTGLSASDTLTITNTALPKPPTPTSGGGGSVDVWLFLLGGLLMMLTVYRRGRCIFR